MHGYSTKDLITSSIISIPKDVNPSISTNNNYREITLFNYICKVIEYAVKHICGKLFYTSDMQFGYKPQHSTMLCSLMYSIRK